MKPERRNISGTTEVYRTNPFWSKSMLKFLGGTVGIIFLIGLVVVIMLFKLVF